MNILCIRLGEVWEKTDYKDTGAKGKTPTLYKILSAEQVNIH